MSPPDRLSRPRRAPPPPPPSSPVAEAPSSVAAAAAESREDNGGAAATATALPLSLLPPVVVQLQTGEGLPFFVGLRRSVLGSSSSISVSVSEPHMLAAEYSSSSSSSIAPASGESSDCAIAPAVAAAAEEQEAPTPPPTRVSLAIVVIGRLSKHFLWNSLLPSQLRELHVHRACSSSSLVQGRAGGTGGSNLAAALPLLPVCPAAAAAAAAAGPPLGTFTAPVPDGRNPARMVLSPCRGFFGTERSRRPPLQATLSQRSQHGGGGGSGSSGGGVGAPVWLSASLFDVVCQNVNSGLVATEREAGDVKSQNISST